MYRVFKKKPPVFERIPNIEYSHGEQIHWYNFILTFYEYIRERNFSGESEK